MDHLCHGPLLSTNGVLPERRHSSTSPPNTRINNLQRAAQQQRRVTTWCSNILIHNFIGDQSNDAGRELGTARRPIKETSTFTRLFTFLFTLAFIICGFSRNCNSDVDINIL